MSCVASEDLRRVTASTMCGASAFSATVLVRSSAGLFAGSAASLIPDAPPLARSVYSPSGAAAAAGNSIVTASGLPATWAIVVPASSVPPLSTRIVEGPTDSGARASLNVTVSVRGGEPPNAADSIDGGTPSATATVAVEARSWPTLSMTRPSPAPSVYMSVGVASAGTSSCVIRSVRSPASSAESGAPSATELTMTRAGGSPDIMDQWAALSASVPVACATGSPNVTSVAVFETVRAETTAGAVASTAGYTLKRRSSASDCTVDERVAHSESGTEALYAPNVSQPPAAARVCVATFPDMSEAVTLGMNGPSGAPAGIVNVCAVLCVFGTGCMACRVPGPRYSIVGFLMRSDVEASCAALMTDHDTSNVTVSPGLTSRVPNPATASSWRPLEESTWTVSGSGPAASAASTESAAPACIVTWLPALSDRVVPTYRTNITVSVGCAPKWRVIPFTGLPSGMVTDADAPRPGADTCTPESSGSMPGRAFLSMGLDPPTRISQSDAEAVPLTGSLNSTSIVVEPVRRAEATVGSAVSTL